MIQINKRISILMVGLSLTLVSCDQFYFSNPQPVDAENLYEFPPEFVGSWAEDGDSIFIGKDYFIHVEYEEKKVARKEVDTSSRYMIRNRKIYVIDDTKNMQVYGGFPIREANDSIFYNRREAFELELGRNIFLRKGPGYYILNSKQSNEWWEIFLIELNSEGDIITRYLSEKDIKKIPNLQTIHFARGHYYLEAQWNQIDITELIHREVFSDTIFILEKKKKNPFGG